MKHAVCMLLFHPVHEKKEVLAISRGAELNDWGLVGGKAEEGESLLDAVVREAREETGFCPCFSSDCWYLVFSSLCTVNARSYMTTTFMFTGDYLLSHPLLVTEEGTVAWKTPRDLCAPTCTFGAYNLALFRALGIM